MPDHAHCGPVFDAAFRTQFERLLRWRRDVRHFRSDPIDPALLQGMLDLAALAPSVGFSQPTRFVLVESAAARAALRANFLACSAAAQAGYAGERAALYAKLKLEGLEDAPVQLSVFCDEATEVGHGLGQHTMPETRRYSVVAAIQTLWLALRAQGIGLGWVSILDPARVQADLDVPATWSFVAHCCIGYPAQVRGEPELLQVGWEQRAEVVTQPLRR